MGVVFVKDEQRNGMAFAEPSALTENWTLRLAEPLLTPTCAYPAYLGAIFTGVLKNGLPFTDGWAGQILSAEAWLQVAILLGYSRAEAMRAMHKGLHPAYATPNPTTSRPLSKLCTVFPTGYQVLGRRRQNRFST